MHSLRSIILILIIVISSKKTHSQQQTAPADPTHSLPQARLWKITFTNNRHRIISLDTTLLVIKCNGKIHYLAGSPAQGYKTIKALDNPGFETGQWVYSPEGESGNKSTTAYRLCTPFTRQSLPKEYIAYILSANHTPGTTPDTTRETADPTDQIIGKTLNAENPNRCSDLAAALSQTHDPILVEAKLSALIADQRLDEYNRSLLQQLRQSYLQRLHARHPIPQHSEELAAH